MPLPGKSLPPLLMRPNSPENVPDLNEIVFKSAGEIASFTFKMRTAELSHVTLLNEAVLLEVLKVASVKLPEAFPPLSFSVELLKLASVVK